MRRSKLSDHTFQKGKFITPINAIPLMHELEDESRGLMAACQSTFGLD